MSYKASQVIFRKGDHIPALYMIKQGRVKVHDGNGDKNMIGTILRNLLSNALKFTYRKGTIRLEAVEHDQDYVRFSVIDNGMGIDRKNITKLFDLDSIFTRHGTEAEEGTGLGMVLCKDFVEKNQGTIWVESEKGRGSAFHFTIPKAHNLAKAKQI